MPVPKGVDPKKFDDCVDQVKEKQGKKVNAYAVCNASLKKADEATTTEQKPEETPAEPKVKLAPGLFSEFTLGSSLKQAPTGNIITNLKANALNYEQVYKDSTKNVQMTAEDFKNGEVKKSSDQELEKAHIGFKKLQDEIEDKEGYSKERSAKIAAAVGRKKYGKKQMAQMAAEGKKKG